MDIENLIAGLPANEQEKLLQQVADYKAALERELKNTRAQAEKLTKNMDKVGGGVCGTSLLEELPRDKHDQAAGPVPVWWHLTPLSNMWW